MNYGSASSDDPNTVCHVYKGDDDCDIMDELQWYQANPGLGIFRSLKELRKQMEVAERQPTKESQYRNQFLNQRISADHIAFPPNVWKPCGDPIDLEVFRNNKVYAGLDLSARNDLTAAVLCAEDEDSVVHVLPFVFCPTSGVEDRARRDRAPYDLWIKQGDMYPIGGKTMDFDQIAETLKHELDVLDIFVDEIHFDKWNIDNFKAACERQGAFAGTEWIGVPQYFTDMGHRLTSLLSMMLEKRIRHGSHPVLNMSASVAVAKSGREGLSALAKDLSTQRIDPIVALVMAAYPLGDGRENVEDFDVAAWVG
jgi:phage terminase large subunit-like protein